MAPAGVAAATGKRVTAVRPDVVVRALAHATTGQKDAGAAVVTLEVGAGVDCNRNKIDRYRYNSYTYRNF